MNLFHVWFGNSAIWQVDLEEPISLMLHLLIFQKFYKLIGQADLYINYVYKLYDLHMLSNNKIEAAFTLLKHAETLSVSFSKIPLFSIVY